MTIKPQKKLLDSTKSIRSKLIIPAKSIFVQVGSKAITQLMLNQV